MVHPVERRKHEARQQAKELEHEVVTPAGAAALWGRSPVTVREAARERKIETWETVRIMGREVRMYRLSSCEKHWGEANPVLLADMREHALTMWVQDRGGMWAILHPEPIVLIDDRETRADLGTD